MDENSGGLEAAKARWLAEKNLLATEL